MAASRGHQAHQRQSYEGIRLAAVLDGYFEDDTESCCWNGRQRFKAVGIWDNGFTAAFEEPALLFFDETHLPLFVHGYVEGDGAVGRDNRLAMTI